MENSTFDFPPTVSFDVCMTATPPQNGQGSNATPNTSCPTIGQLLSTSLNIIRLLIKKV
jgi:hypothetical protein